MTCLSICCAPGMIDLTGGNCLDLQPGEICTVYCQGPNYFWRSTGCRMPSYEFGSQQSHQLVSTNVFLQGACTASSRLFVKSNTQHLSLRSGLLWSSQLSMWNWYCDMWAHCHLDRLRVVGTLCATGGAEKQQKPGWFWILLGERMWKKFVLFLI